jgi:hypothetical protein
MQTPGTADKLKPPVHRPATSPYFAKPFIPDAVLGSHLWALQRPETSSSRGVHLPTPAYPLLPPSSSSHRTLLLLLLIEAGFNFDIAC